jgi:peptidoglycan/LPS O-acetylase OafA/YrhL
MANVARAAGRSSDYWPALDGLRALAFLAVLGLHALPACVPGGFLGVDVFFVLSGFLITTLLHREWERTGTIDLKHFYYRRGLRLLPALAVLVVVCCLGSMLFCSGEVAHEIRKSATATLLYYANWRTVRAGLPADSVATCDVLRHTWSLSVEEQFYLVWPLLLGALLWLKVGRRRLAMLLVVMIAGVTALRIALYPTGGVSLYFRSDSRVDGPLVGCLAGLLYRWGLLPRRRAACVALQVAAVAALLLLCWQSRLPLSLRRRFLYYGGFTLFAAETAVVLLGLLAGPPRVLRWLLEFPALVWVGRISYGLYLWHFPVLTAGRALLRPYLPGGWLVAVNVAVTFGLAALSFYAVERPFLRLKDRPRPGVAALALPA